MSSGKNVKTKRVRKQSRQHEFLIYAGLTFLSVACFIVFATYWPIIVDEVGYNVRRIAPTITAPRPIIPIDKKYGIVIPKIGANAHVIPDVDPFNSQQYQRALTKGVAQAKGTGIPGKPGNIFLFAHSSENFYYATRYNSIFYLLTKLERGDDIRLYYNNTQYIYTVTDKILVKANAVSYLNPVDKSQETVTLMTCWPPGTSYRRLIVIAKRIK